MIAPRQKLASMAAAQKIFAPLFFLLLAFSEPVQAQSKTSSATGIGFASPAAALTGLRSRSGVVFSDYNGWTIAEDKSRNEIWSFTPNAHPAHPAVVRRTVIEQNGVLSLDMDVLCGGEKSDCDKLVAQFEALNEDVRQHLAGNKHAQSSGWQPSSDDVTRAQAHLERFLDAIDDMRVDDAYALFGDGFKAEVTRAQFAAILERQGGTATQRQRHQTTWYKDPPQAPKPGIYVVFNLPCTLSDGRACMDSVVLHEPRNGAFVVQRYERTYMTRERR